MPNLCHDPLIRSGSMVLIVQQACHLSGHIHEHCACSQHDSNGTPLLSAGRNSTDACGACPSHVNDMLSSPAAFKGPRPLLFPCQAKHICTLCLSTPGAACCPSCALAACRQLSYMAQRHSMLASRQTSSPVKTTLPPPVAPCGCLLAEGLVRTKTSKSSGRHSVAASVEASKRDSCMRHWVMDSFTRAPRRRAQREDCGMWPFQTLWSQCPDLYIQYDIRQSTSSWGHYHSGTIRLAHPVKIIC